MHLLAPKKVGSTAANQWAWSGLERDKSTCPLVGIKLRQVVHIWGPTYLEGIHLSRLYYWLTDYDIFIIIFSGSNLESPPGSFLMAWHLIFEPLVLLIDVIDLAT